MASTTIDKTNLRLSLSPKTIRTMSRLAAAKGISLDTFAEHLVIAEHARLRAIEQLFSPNARAVANRLQRDHRLTINGIAQAALNDCMECLEEDVALNGANDDGARERLFVEEAKAAAAGKQPDWALGGHEIGSKSYRDMMKATRERNHARKRQNSSKA